jgi:phage FluMu protein Com
MKWLKDRCYRCKKWVDETQIVNHPHYEGGENGVCTKCEKIIIEKGTA